MASKEIAVDLATIEDAHNIAQLSRDLIETGLGWSWTPQRVLRSIRNRDTCVIAARTRNRRLVAFAIMDFGDERGHLALLAVQQDYQGQGLGRRLVDWLTESALVAGLREVNVELRVSNLRAHGFYRALGFRDVALVPRYYSGREAAIRMTREIGVAVKSNSAASRRPKTGPLR